MAWNYREEYAVAGRLGARESWYPRNQRSTVEAAIVIFNPLEHEPLTKDDWDEDVARAFVRSVVLDADGAYDDELGWPVHPEDRYGAEAEPFRGVYFGSAGTMWALTRLAQTHGVALRHDYGSGVARCEKSYRSNPFETGTVVPSYFLGTVGIMIARYAITGDRAILDRMETEIRENVGNPTREALWGSPGTALAALLLRERDGDERYDNVLRAVQDELWETWQSADQDGGLLWEQDLYGRRCKYIGAAHGAVGNLAPMLRALDLLSYQRRETLLKRIPALLETYLLRDGDAANWFSLGDPREGNRMQWCHGSAGVIMGLASYPTHDERVEQMLTASGFVCNFDDHVVGNLVLKNQLEAFGRHIPSLHHPFFALFDKNHRNETQGGFA